MNEPTNSNVGETYVCTACHKSFQLAPKGTESGSRLVAAIKSMVMPGPKCPHCGSGDVVHADTARVTTKRVKKKPVVGGSAENQPR